MDVTSLFSEFGLSGTKSLINTEFIDKIEFQEF